MKNKDYFYTNDIGEKKFITIEFPPVNDEYSVTLWSVRTGDLCGSGKMTYQQLKEYFNYYHMTMDF